MVTGESISQEIYRDWFCWNALRVGIESKEWRASIHDIRKNEAKDCDSNIYTISYRIVMRINEAFNFESFYRMIDSVKQK